MIEFRIHKKHFMGGGRGNLTFSLASHFPEKTHYGWRKFTLKMRVQALGNRDSPNSWFQSNVKIGQKHILLLSLYLQAKRHWVEAHYSVPFCKAEIEKSTTTLFSQSLNVAESRVPLFFCLQVELLTIFIKQSSHFY